MTTAFNNKDRIRVKGYIRAGPTAFVHQKLALVELYHFSSIRKTGWNKEINKISIYLKRNVAHLNAAVASATRWVALSAA